MSWITAKVNVNIDTTNEREGKGRGLSLPCEKVSCGATKMYSNQILVTVLWQMLEMFYLSEFPTVGILTKFSRLQKKVSFSMLVFQLLLSFLGENHPF